MANGDGTFMTKDQKIDTYIMLLVDRLRPSNFDIEQNPT